MSKEIKAANDGISVTSNILKTSASFLTDKKLHEKLLANIGQIVACGELIKCVLGLVTPSKPDPLMLQLQELERQIHKLEDKMNSHFSELEAFITEHNFYANCVEPASTMMRFLRDTVSTPCVHSFEIFREKSAKPTPIDCAYKMISYLEQNATNPLKKAMDADPLQTSVTFNKWKKIFLDVLNVFLYLECMVNGMFWDKNMYGPNKLEERIVEFNALMREWEEEYKRKDGFWPKGVQDLIHHTQDNYQHVGNAAKADVLQKRLGEILTNNAFYVIVYNDCFSYGQHSFNFKRNKYLDSYRRGKCNVVVYRSLRMHVGTCQTVEDLNKMELQVESCRHDTIPCSRQFEGFPGDLMQNRIDNTGFVGMIRKCHNPVIRDVNSWRQWGPGWYITAHTSLHQNPRFHDGESPEWILIAGYK